MSKHSTADAIIRLEQLENKCSTERYEIRCSLIRDRINALTGGEERFMRQRLAALHREEKRIAHVIEVLESELLEEVMQEAL